MPSMAEGIAAAAAQLTAVTETPRLDAELLLAHALGCSRAQLLARLREPVPPCAFEEFLGRRLAYEPIAYITGEWEFFSLSFSVRAPVLVPRPETEHLVEAALAHLQGMGERRGRVLDLCTGSGCVAVAVAKNAPCEMAVSDLSPKALELAEENARRHGLGVAIHCGDLFGALPDEARGFDVITCNPPYVCDGDWALLSPVIRLHEDPRALLAGADGLDVVRRLVDEGRDWLAPGGLLALEMGDGQWPAVRGLLERGGYWDIDVRHDLAGIPRIATGKLAAAFDRKQRD